MVIRSDPAVVNERLDAEFARLLDLLSARTDVEGVWRFGSSVTRVTHATSDLDVLVVQQTSLGPVERSVALRLELAPTVALDLFVFTPDEFSQGGRFIDHIVTTGRRER